MKQFLKSVTIRDAWNRIYKHLGLWLILSFSFILRIYLVFSGGQYFWPDERRYQRSRMAVESILSGDIGFAALALNSPDHFLFKIIGIIPAALEKLIGKNLLIPSVFFSIFSVLNIWLVWKIVRRAGENDRTAYFAAGLLALSATFFYYSRHLMPYDLAFCFGLLSLFIALHRPCRPMDSVLCGVFACCTFLTYNGYWTLAGFALLTHGFYSSQSLRETCRRFLISGSAFILPVVMWLNADAIFSRGTLFQQMISFSESINQGSFAEGWLFPFEFLWHAEHFFLAFWLAAFVYSIQKVCTGERRTAWILSVGAVIFIYGTLALFSLLDKFVVYGRLVRQLVPFLCVLGALALERLWVSGRLCKTFAAVLVSLAVIQAGFNFYQPLIQIFPFEFREKASQAKVLNGAGHYEILYDYHIYPEPLIVQRPSGKTILKTPHPLQYLPYQYEGYTPEQRQKLRGVDIGMELILTSDGTSGLLTDREK